MTEKYEVEVVVAGTDQSFGATFDDYEDAKVMAGAVMERVDVDTTPGNFIDVWNDSTLFVPRGKVVAVRIHERAGD